mgnify:CR=1 FL=1|tara:strand:- start:4105 stop:4851 length:747 start_codon:yes stop_codon:yes gene_type:complete
MIASHLENEEKLKLDEFYYGDFGKQYLSNSDIINLLTNPQGFRVKQEQTKPMLEGRYFHTKILEPQKIDTFTILDVATRSTKIYKDLADELKPNVLLLKEKDHLDFLCNKMTSNLECSDLIYEDGNEFEVPRIREIMNESWKGKADILNHKEKLIIDIKTSGDIDKFKYSAHTYNYDSQAYIYQRMFGMQLIFIVIDKRNGRLKICDCSDSFIDRGREKVEKAIEVYHKFFSNEATEDIRSYIYKETL